VHHAGDGEERTELFRHAEAVAALLRFLKQPMSAGTSQLLSRFEAIRERVDVDMPSSSSERLPSLETRVLKKRAASPDAGSGAGSISPAMKIPRESAEPRL
jgi:hypothetical protein